MRLILLLLGTIVCIACLACATSLMILDKPWWTWFIMICLAFTSIPKVRI